MIWEQVYVSNVSYLDAEKWQHERKYLGEINVDWIKRYICLSLGDEKFFNKEWDFRITAWKYMVKIMEVNKKYYT